MTRCFSGIRSPLDRLQNLFSVLRQSKFIGHCQAAIKNDINFFLDFDFQ